MRQSHWLLFVAAAGVLAAQETRTVVDNDQVRALQVVVQPHVKTRLHDHKLNRVMIYLQPGRQNLDYQDGHRVALDWKAGEAKWSPASGLHVAEITSAAPVTIVEVELKKPADSTKSATGPLDPVKLDPRHYRLDFENPQVRVLHARLGPRESAPLHEHLLHRLVVYLTDQKIRVTTADGKSEVAEHKAGDVAWAGPAKHREENLNSTPFEVAVVELKN